MQSNRLHHKVCVCVSAVVSSPGAGPAGTCSYLLKIKSNSHAVAVPGCDNTQIHITAVVVPLCWFLNVLTVQHINFQNLNLTTSNIHSCKIQIRHTRNVLNIWMDMHGLVPEHQLLWAKYPRMDCEQ